MKKCSRSGIFLGSVGPYVGVPVDRTEYFSVCMSVASSRSFGCNQSRTAECVFTFEVTSDYKVRVEGLGDRVKLSDP